jgi:hypothetical protein
MYMIKSITLVRENQWTRNPADMGAMKGTIALVRDNKTELTLEISEEQTRKIIAVLAESIIETAKSVAQLMVTDVAEQLNTSNLIEGTSI